MPEDLAAGGVPSSGPQPDAGTALDRLFGVAVVLGGLMNRRLSEHGLTPARAEVIWLLHHQGPLTQRRLSEVLECSPRNVTGLVDGLQAAGLVVRAPHPTDRRATLITLTPEGEVLAAPWHADRDTGAHHLFGDTSPADLATFIAVLDRVLARLRQDE